jgi:hypothetical protein
MPPAAQPPQGTVRVVEVTNIVEILQRLANRRIATPDVSPDRRWAGLVIAQFLQHSCRSHQSHAAPAGSGTRRNSAVVSAAPANRNRRWQIASVLEKDQAYLK